MESSVDLSSHDLDKFWYFLCDKETKINPLLFFSFCVLNDNC